MYYILQAQTKEFTNNRCHCIYYSNATCISFSILKHFELLVSLKEKSYTYKVYDDDYYNYNHYNDHH